MGIVRIHLRMFYIGWPEENKSCYNKIFELSERKIASTTFSTILGKS